MSRGVWLLIIEKGKKELQCEDDKVTWRREEERERKLSIVYGATEMFSSQGNNKMVGQRS